MKQVFAYSAIVLLLATAVACNKTDSAISGDGQIRFALTSPETRALVENVNDLQANQTIKVFDLLGSANYFDADETVSYSGGAWNFDSGKGYTWKAGTHKFFGYTNEAGTFADGVFTVSKTLTTADANQVDIVYSNIVSKTAEQAKADNYKAVTLNMSHLFSAVAISLKNATSAPVTVKSVTTNIPNQGSATISYAGDEPVVTPGAVTQSGQYIAGTALSNVEVAADGIVDVLGQAAATEDTYWLVWPQTLAKGDVKVTVSYTMNNKDYDDVEVSLPATPEGGWARGNKYLYTLNIYPTEVQLIFKVQPWDQQTQTINTATGSINMSNVTWMNSVVRLTPNGEEVNTVVNSAYSVYMYHNAYVKNSTTGAWEQRTGYYPAQGFFTVNYPNAGLYKIGLIPMPIYGVTEIDESKYEIYIYRPSTQTWTAQSATGETISNDTVYFQVRASSNQDGAQHKAYIDIWFKADGSDEWVSAQSEVRANYALTIPATN